MTVNVNDQPRDVPDSTTVAELLRLLDLHRQACAVEVNRELVPKPQHPDRALADGDRIEIVTLVGGG